MASGIFIAYWQAFCKRSGQFVRGDWLKDHPLGFDWKYTSRRKPGG